MRWWEITGKYPYSPPRFWSWCNWFHRIDWWIRQGKLWWYKGHHPYVFCKRCEVWWEE